MALIGALPLTHGYVAKVEVHDLSWLHKHTWCAVGVDRGTHIYAATSLPVLNSQGKRVWKTYYLHRLLMGQPEGFEVDHINNDTLDCLKANLRIATGDQNKSSRLKNKLGSSIYKGVAFQKASPAKPWQAQIGHDSRIAYLGVFEFEDDAGRAYDRAALKHFGEFARLNFPKENYL